MSARILIIEDNPTNMELMGYLLSAFGHTPLMAYDGNEGVAAALSAAPDLILCDVHLPRLDGYGVVRALKDNPATAGVPVLAVTALAMVGDRERLLEAGFDGYLAKPIEPDTFVSEVEAWVRRAAPGRAPGPAQQDPGQSAPPPQPERRATILIVDDHVLNREFLITLLGYGGHRLLEAADGVEGLAMVAAERPDLVISDILMPNMDGYEFVSRLRADPASAAIPVIFYTAIYREREVSQVARDFQVRWVLPKPSDPELILRTVHAALGLAEPAGAPAAGRAGELGRMALLDRALASYLVDAESGSELINGLARGGQPAPDAGLGNLAERLSGSLSSLQAVSLRLTALIELGIELGGLRDPAALLQAGCRVARNICGARYACIGVIEPGAERLRHWFAAGEGAPARAVADDPRAGVLGKLLDGREPVRLDGGDGDPRALGLPAGHPPVHAFLGVPIVSRERVHGWLYLVDTPAAGGFSEIDERIAVTVSAQLAVAYDNLALYDEVRRHHAQLSADMAARARQDEAMQRFRAAMDATADAIFLIDRGAMCFVDVNATACSMFGYSREEFLAVGMLDMPAADRACLYELYRSILAGERSDAMAEIQVRRKAGSMLSVEVQCRTVRSGSGWMLVAVARDVTERKETERRLLKLAHFDALTGLPNRGEFNGTLGRALEQADAQRCALAVLLLDIDRFKSVNDTFGHPAGDELLRQLASRLMDGLRMRDTVGRVGGDEFAALLLLPGGTHSALAVVEKVRAALRAPFSLEGHEVRVTASIGVALYPQDGADADSLVRNAGTALYACKEAGRDAFRFFTAEMNAQSLARLELENALRRAVDQQEFELHYQPKVNIASGRVSGAEALLRWQRPGHGLVSPALFIPILEETGLINRLGAWVLREACRQISAWGRSHIGPVRVSVNVSGIQFFAGGLQQEVLGAIREHDIAPDLLELELTESSLMSNAHTTTEVLRNLKQLGVRISIDDFGTGYSSLAYLKRFPIDKLKIDQGFVRELSSSPDDAAIVLAIIGMAHSLKLEVVAEGVETEAQLAYLRRHGCDEMQGYLFSRPLPAAQFAQLLRDGRQLAASEVAAVDGQETLLIVDDDAFMLDVLADFLAQDGYRILTAQSAADGFDLLACNRVQVILCDQCMPLISGTEFMERIKQLYPDTFRIMLSAYADLAPIMDAINHGVIDRFYTKPWKGALLRENIREGFRLHRLLHGRAGPL